MAEELDYLWNRRYQIKVRALTNRLYQQERQRIMEFREGAIKALSIAAGATSVAKIADPRIVATCSAIVVIGSALALVFGFGNKARDSAKRSTEWAHLERDIDAAGERDFTEAQLCQWAAKANEIEAGEPAANTRLLDQCHRRACEALGGEPTGKSSWLARIIPPILIP